MAGLTSNNRDPNEQAAGGVPNDTSDRRRFFAQLVGSGWRLGGLLIGLVLTLWALASTRFMIPNVERRRVVRFKAGLPDRFRLGTVDVRFRDTQGVWLACAEYQGVQQIVALSSVCTHLGCITIWQESEQKFKCPCHGSGFWSSGINFEGPAPRPLERYAIRLADDGQIEVDRSKIFRQELGQWDDPESFLIYDS